ncbi:hypothetical protein MTO79_13785 (plasmid) [Lactococcus lactis]|nr:hypothetical protein [Lactococcus lactis]UOB69252.1 hypothetical protein MTO79_13785 [Lactococcus lactis]
MIFERRFSKGHEKLRQEQQQNPRKTSQIENSVQSKRNPKKDHDPGMSR